MKKVAHMKYKVARARSRLDELPFGTFNVHTAAVRGVNGIGHIDTLLRPCAAKRGSTIGEGGDTTTSSPGRSPKQPLPGIRLHDPLHDRQACPEFNAFDQGVGQICPR